MKPLNAWNDLSNSECHCQNHKRAILSYSSDEKKTSNVKIIKGLSHMLKVVRMVRWRPRAKAKPWFAREISANSSESRCIIIHVLVLLSWACACTCTCNCACTAELSMCLYLYLCLYCWARACMDALCDDLYTTLICLQQPAWTRAPPPPANNNFFMQGRCC